MAAIDRAGPIPPFVVKTNPNTYMKWAIGLAVAGFVVGAVASVAFANYSSLNAPVASLSGTLSGRILIGFTMSGTIAFGLSSGVMSILYKDPYSKKEKKYVEAIEAYEDSLGAVGYKYKNQKERARRLTEINNKMTTLLNKLQDLKKEDHLVEVVLDKETVVARFDICYEHLISVDKGPKVSRLLAQLNYLNSRRTTLLADIQELDSAPTAE